MSTRAQAVFELKSWDEQPWVEQEDGTKLTLAVVTKTYRGNIEGEATAESLMYYRADGSAIFTGLERVSGSVAGRFGTFVLMSGTFRDGAATCEGKVVPGSGASALKGLSGEIHYVATHAEYPKVSVTLDYDFDAA